MPELPEVETVVRTLAPHVLKREILSMDEVRPCRVPESLPCSKAVGFTVAEVFRRGKFIVARLAEKDCEELFWVTHLRMTGSLMAYEGIMRESEAANPGKYTRCVIKLGSRAGEATTEEGCRFSSMMCAPSGAFSLETGRHWMSGRPGRSLGRSP